jgi:hypothetical protein
MIILTKHKPTVMQFLLFTLFGNLIRKPLAICFLLRNPPDFGVSTPY